jgi:hypothetical protein
VGKKEKSNITIVQDNSHHTQKIFESNSAPQRKDAQEGLPKLIIPYDQSFIRLFITKQWVLSSKDCKALPWGISRTLPFKEKVQSNPKETSVAKTEFLMTKRRR